LDPDAVWDGEWGRPRDWCIRWGMVIVEGQWAALEVNVEHSIVTNGEVVA